MAVIDITDKRITELLTMPKHVENPRARTKEEESCQQLTYTLIGRDEERFVLFKRQNTHEGMRSDFSCGLAWVTPSGERLTLCRYNGPSHPHTNHLDGSRFEFVAHIHMAREDYHTQRNKIDGFAEVTTRFRTLEGALHCLVTDCKVTGIDTTADAPELFD